MHQFVLNEQQEHMLILFKLVEIREPLVGLVQQEQHPVLNALLGPTLMEDKQTETYALRGG